jgi:hypothetical protein
LKVGIAGTLEAFGASGTIDLKAAAKTRYALLLTDAKAADGKPVRLTLAYTVANATAGKFTIRLEFIVDGKQDYVTL